MANTFMATTGHFPKAWNARRSTLITKELRNTRYDVEAAISGWLSDGYTLYDIPAEGGLSYLQSKPAGKYLCVWKTCAPKFLASSYTGTVAAGTNNTTHVTLDSSASSENDYYTGMVIRFTSGTLNGMYDVITGYNGTTKVAEFTKALSISPSVGISFEIGVGDLLDNDDFTNLTHVIVTSIVLDSKNKYCGLGQSYIFLKYTGTWDSKLEFNRCECYMSGTEEYSAYNAKLTVANCKIYTKNGDQNGLRDLVDCSISNSEFFNEWTSVDAKANIALNCSGTDLTVENCRFHSSPYSKALFIVLADHSFAVKNCVFEDFVVTDAIQLTGSGTGKVTFENVFIKNSNITVWNSITSGDASVIYYDDLTINKNNVADYRLITAHLDRQTFISDDVTSYAIDTAGIMTDANYASLDTLISTSLENIRGTGYQYSRRYYELSFQDKNPVDEEFKTMFAREQSLLVVWRDDLDETFVTGSGGALKIKNLALYENDGLTAYDYRNNENFFLFAEDAAGTECVFCWYQGMIYPTAFSDFWDDTEYTIKRCFQLLEPPDKLTWRNKINGMSDSPIECSASFQDMTSMYVDKR